MTVPALSVVVPTSGRVDLFLETLASLERQTLADFEVVVTDDSSAADDRTAIETVIRTFGVRTGRAVQYLWSRPRLGQARNTNQGLRAASGRLLRILHSDDVLAPRALEAEAALFADSRLNLEVLHHQVEAFVDRPRFRGRPSLSLVQASLFFRSCLHSGTPLPSALVFRRELFETLGGMREDLDFLCDWEFAARLVIEQHRRHKFLAILTPGFVGWRVHADSTTGRLWHRHFLEHEAFMREIRGRGDIADGLIGDERAQAEFFARAVRYRYRRLAKDARHMTPRMAVKALPRLLRCAASPSSLAERLTPAPWSALGRRLRKTVTLPPAQAPAANAAPPRLEPRNGRWFGLTARVSTAVIARGKAYARRSGRTTPEGLEAGVIGPGPVSVGDVVNVAPGMRPPASGDTAADVHVETEYNNSTNLWPLRDLLRAARVVRVAGLNGNAFVEPVLQQLLKLTAEGVVADVTLADNQHLTSFGFKALLEKLFPREFSWIGQASEGPARHRLRFRRVSPSRPWHTTPHDGWTFGMLTTGKRLGHVERFIESIAAQCTEPYEIVLVSAADLGPLGRRPRVRVLHFAEHDDRGWITRKKNLIAASARHSDILICHDRFWLAPDFLRTANAWGFAYGLAAPRVVLADGTRGLDWAVVSSQNHVWSTGGLLDYRAYSPFAYNPGGATLVRKTFWQEFPWNENLFWNEHEDVELCRRVQRAGGVIALSAATLVTAEDRWVNANPLIPYCEEHDVLYGAPVGEQRIRFLSGRSAKALRRHAALRGELTPDVIRPGARHVDHVVVEHR